MTRILFAIPFVAALAVLAWCGAAAEAQPKKMHRVGMLRVDGSADSRAQGLTEVFRRGLRELGYEEGKNIVIEVRHAEGRLDRLPRLAAELVAFGPEVIVSQGTPATLALQQATKTIPIVVGGAGDLVGEGFVASLARPGGNITGSTNIDPALSAKRLALLKELIPDISRLAVLYHGGPGGDRDEVGRIAAAAREWRIQAHFFQVNEPGQFGDAFAAMDTQRVDALIILHGSFTMSHRKQLLALAADRRVPTLSGEASWSEAGALLSYGYDRLYQWRRAANFVDKILKGTSPADLPVEQPLRFELVVNVRTARALGLAVPRTILTRADRVLQ